MACFFSGFCALARATAYSLASSGPSSTQRPLGTCAFLSVPVGSSGLRTAWSTKTMARATSSSTERMSPNSTGPVMTPVTSVADGPMYCRYFIVLSTCLLTLRSAVVPEQLLGPYGREDPRGSGRALLHSPAQDTDWRLPARDRKSTRLNSSHTVISYAGFCF